MNTMEKMKGKAEQLLEELSCIAGPSGLAAWKIKAQTFLLFEYLRQHCAKPEPIDYETVWGVPEGIGAMTEPPGADFCVIEGRQCNCWHQGCMAEDCIYDGDAGDE